MVTTRRGVAAQDRMRVAVLALAVVMSVLVPVAVADGQDADARQIPVSRIAGADRYETAAALAVRGADAGPGGRVWIATGENHPDALAAGATGDPVVLVRPDSLPGAAAEALRALDADEVVAVGGPRAIADDVLLAAGRAATARTSRESGPDRYATAAAVARRTHPNGATTVWLATGIGFADALAAGPVAAAEEAPVLLTSPTSLPAVARDELRRLAPDEVVVVGGTTAVSERVAEQAASAAGVDAATRVWGSDRYATAVAVAERGVTHHDLDGHTVLATGESFPDALAAGPLAHRVGGPLLLSSHARVPEVVRTFLLDLAPPRISVAGGELALSQTVLHRASRPWLEGACDLYDVTLPGPIQGHPEDQRPELDAASGPWIIDDFRDAWGMAVPARWRYDRVESLEHRGVLFYVDTYEGYDNYLSVTVFCGNPFLMGGGVVLDADDPSQIAREGLHSTMPAPDVSRFDGPALYTAVWYDEPCPPGYAARSSVCAFRFDYVAVDDDVILVHYLAEDGFAHQMTGELGVIADRVAASVGHLGGVDCPASASACWRGGQPGPGR